MRIREGQGTEQEGIDDAEDGDVDADAEGEDEDGDSGKAAIAAQGAEGVANVLKAFVCVVVESSAAFHVSSHAFADVLHGEDVAELAFGFFAGGFGTPAEADEIFGFGFDVEAQLSLHIRCGIGAEKTVIPPPDRSARDSRLAHADCSGTGGCVALRTLATAWA